MKWPKKILQKQKNCLIGSSKRIKVYYLSYFGLTPPHNYNYILAKSTPFYLTVLLHSEVDVTKNQNIGNKYIGIVDAERPTCWLNSHFCGFVSFTAQSLFICFPKKLLSKWGSKRDWVILHKVCEFLQIFVLNTTINNKYLFAKIRHWKWERRWEE